MSARRWAVPHARAEEAPDRWQRERHPMRGGPSRREAYPGRGIRGAATRRRGRPGPRICSARKIFLILDRLKAHEKATVLDWVEAQ